MQPIIGKLIDYFYITTKEDLDKCVALLETKDILYCDTETYPLYDIYGSKAVWNDPWTARVRLFQCNYAGNFAPYVIDILKIGVENCGSLTRLLVNKAIRKIFHYSIFDTKMIRSTLGIWVKNVWCTLVMSRRIGVCTGFRASQMRGHSLKALTRDYLGIDLSKLEQESDWSNPNLTKEQLEYAALDTGAPKESKLDSILGYLYNLFYTTLYTPAPKGFGGYCKLKDYKEPIEVDQAANAILAEIEYTGMPVSVKMLNLIYSTAEAEVEKLKLYLCESFGITPLPVIEYTETGKSVRYVLTLEAEKTLNSPPQLVQLVNKVLKSQGIVLDNVKAESMEAVLKKLKITKSKEESEDTKDTYEDDWEEEESDQELDYGEGHDVDWGIELISKLVKYKELSKLLGTDYRKLINPVTGRVHSSYQCIGASTGRMSSGGKGSFNCQNITKTELLIKFLLSLDPYNTNVIPPVDREIWQLLNMRYAFISDKSDLVWASSDFERQEIKVILTLCRDINGTKIEKLGEEYKLGIRQKPIHPVTGEPYDDPLTDQHIIAGAALCPEVKKILEEEPWNCNKDNLLVAKWRQLGKILNYRLIYLGSAQSLAPELGVSVEEAQAFIDKYFSFPDGFYGMGEYLQSMVIVGTELRWIRLITGELIFAAESNSKGLADKGTVGRKAVNSNVQGLGATETKLALIHAHKAFKELDKKYKDVLNGRKGELIAVVHDEINALVPGQCNFELVPDTKLNEKNNTDCYHKPKTTFDKNNPEHLMAQDYEKALENAMKLGMQETFDILNSEVPSGATCETTIYWKH
jgi:hypothetical protein